MNLKKIYTLFIVVVLLVTLWYVYITNGNHRDKLELLNINREITMEDLITFSRKNTFPNGIPRVVHYNYKGSMIPSQYIPLVKGCVQLNPTVKFVIWTDATSLTLVKEYYPKHVEIYKSYFVSGEALKRSDIIRSFLLHRFGGIYMDLDTRCQRPMDDAMKNEGCFLTIENELQTQISYNKPFSAMNSFMACVSEHRFFNALITNLKKDDNSHIMSNTGPIHLTNFFEKYNATLKVEDYSNKKMYIALAPSALFSPTVKDYIDGRCANPSGRLKVEACKQLPGYRKTEKDVIKKTIVVHLFYHIGYAHNQWMVKQLVKVGDLKGVDVVTSNKYVQ